MGVEEPKELLKSVKLSKAPGASIEDVTVLIDNNSDTASAKKQSFLQHSKVLSPVVHFIWPYIIINIVITSFLWLQSHELPLNALFNCRSRKL